MAWAIRRRRRRENKPAFIYLPSLLLLCIFLICSYQKILSPRLPLSLDESKDTKTADSDDLRERKVAETSNNFRTTLTGFPTASPSSTSADASEIVNEAGSELPSTTSAISCQLQMEEYLRPRIYQWVMNKVPIPMNVKIIQNQYHVIFNTGYIPPKRWYNATFRCNDEQEAATILSVVKPGESSLIIQCPTSIRADDDEVQLDIISVIPEGGNQTIYEMTKFIECEYLDEKEFSPPDTSIGLCTSVAGKESVRNLAYQWAEYHRLIGVDHTWIYINSDYDDGKHLPPKPYISWIPYNFNIKAYNFTDRPWTQRSEFFRLTSQVECVLRARRMGVEWIIFTDIDEYLQIVEDASNGTSTRTSTNDDTNASESNNRPVLKRFLDEYSSNRPGIGSLVLNSIPFGNNFEHDDDFEKPLLMDHIWRNMQNPKDYSWSRWKQIVNPENIHNYAIHWLGGGDVMNEIRLDADKARINHYKDVHKQVKKGSGVFGTEEAKDLVEDKLLMEQFHDKLLEALRN